MCKRDVPADIPALFNSSESPKCAAQPRAGASTEGAGGNEVTTGVRSISP